MKKTTAERLHEIMNEQGLKQADILERAKPFMEMYDTKLTRPDLSQYCSGKVAPSQSKILVLASALNVNEAWLMGYDVPRVRNKMTMSLTSFAEHPAVSTAIKMNSPMAEEMINDALNNINLNNAERDLILAFREADNMTQRNIYRILGLDEKNLSSESSKVVGGDE